MVDGATGCDSGCALLRAELKVYGFNDLIRKKRAFITHYLLWGSYEISTVGSLPLQIA